MVSQAGRAGSSLLQVRTSPWLLSLACAKTPSLERAVGRRDRERTL
jgi:hypothetical protein